MELMTVPEPPILLRPRAKKTKALENEIPNENKSTVRERTLL